MTTADWIVLVCLAATLAAAIVFLLKKREKKKKNCDGNCLACPLGCENKKEE